MDPVPVVHAQAFIKPLAHARTIPGLFSCQNGNGHCAEYVVKFHGRLGARIICEFMAALIGQQLGMPIPPIAIVEIDPALLAAVPSPEVREILAGGPGPHFGSLHLAGQYNVWPTGFDLPCDMLPLMADIFAFDMLIQNVDRTDRPGQGKPNLLLQGREAWLVDHELAFSFLDDLGPPRAPWELRGLPFVPDHIFFSRLRSYGKSNALSFVDFLARVAALADALLDEMVTATPEGWKNPAKSAKIVAHVAMVRENPGAFERGLLEVLA